MKRALITLLVLGLAAEAGSGYASPPRRIELAVIVHPSNRDTLTRRDLEDIFLRKQRHWSNGRAIVPLNAVPRSAARHEFDRVVFDMSPDAIARYWLDARIRSGAHAPRELRDGVVTRRLVERLADTIAYVPADLPLDNVRIVFWIRNGRLIAP